MRPHSFCKGRHSLFREDKGNSAINEQARTIWTTLVNYIQEAQGSLINVLSTPLPPAGTGYTGPQQKTNNES